MDNQEITWYMQELGMHGFGAHREYQTLKEAIDNPETIQTRIVWFHLTSLLAHAAMISKYLDPISLKGVKGDRKRELRSRLHVDDNSAILSRDARNNIEHFDERIDNWVQLGAGQIMEVVLPNRRGYEFLHADQKRIKRLLLVDEMVFVSENQDGSQLELSLEPLVSEAQRIGGDATRWIGEESPYHYIYPR